MPDSKKRGVPFGIQRLFKFRFEGLRPGMEILHSRNNPRAPHEMQFGLTLTNRSTPRKQLLGQRVLPSQVGE